MADRLLSFAKQLRREQTDAERRLWRELRAGRFAGAKFKRQQPIGGYIVDLVCFEERLVIELDGGQHQVQTDYDGGRDKWLGSQGFGAAVKAANLGRWKSSLRQLPGFGRKAYPLQGEVTSPDRRGRKSHGRLASQDARVGAIGVASKLVGLNISE
jgi:hypothetical protein